MSIWNLIRDWFVVYIWGGSTSTGDLYDVGNLGPVKIFVDDVFDDQLFATTDSVGFKINDFIEIYNYNEVGNLKVYVSFGDWLSTTSTIIVLVLLLIAFGYLIVNLFKMFSNIFSLKR